MPKAGIQFQKKDEYATPREVMDFFGPFDYDPATTSQLAHENSIHSFDTIKTDGLAADWSVYGRIWINPPFTRKFEFLQKAIETVKKAPKTKIFFLLPIESLTTKVFHQIISGGGYTMWLPNGRVKFDDGSGRYSSPAFGSVVLELKKRGRSIKHWKLYE